jgi:geranylgeranyl pyrophosphate synthase
MSVWERRLDEYGLKIKERLLSIFQREIEAAVAYHPFIGELYKDLCEYVARRGKRLASCSTLLTYRGFGKEVDGRILTVCAGIELYRHSILVHDDLVDDDSVRRGGCSIHRKYSRIKNKTYGEGVAVFAGNILYTLALKAFNSSGFESGKMLEVMIVLNDAFRAVNESQVLDLMFGYAKPDVKEWYVMASRRAASLFKASLVIGGLLADASTSDLQLLRDAAEHMGYCFDIQDDIIDTFASEEEYGRKPGGDLLKHKKPLHIVYMYALADKAQLETIERLVKEDTVESLGEVRGILSDCGALEAAKNRSREHAESAKNLIAETKMSREVKAFLTDFIDYVKGSLNWYK